MERVTDFLVECNNKDIQEQVVRAYIQRAKNPASKDSIRFQAWINTEVNVKGFRWSSKASESILVPELLKWVASRNGIHDLMARAWIDTIPEKYKPICEAVKSLGLETRLEDLTTQLVAQKETPEAKFKAGEIIDLVLPEISKVEMVDQRSILEIALFVRGFELYNKDSKPSTPEKNGVEKNSLLKPLFSQIQMIATGLNPEDPALCELRIFAQHLIKMCDEKEFFAQLDKSVNAEIEDFFKNHQEVLAYLSKKLGDFSTQSNILSATTKVKQQCLEVLNALAPRIDKVASLRGEVAYDPDALEKLQGEIKDIAEIKKHLELLLTFSEISESDDNTNTGYDTNIVVEAVQERVSDGQEISPNNTVEIVAQVKPELAALPKPEELICNNKATEPVNTAELTNAPVVNEETNSALVHAETVIINCENEGSLAPQSQTEMVLKSSRAFAGHALSSKEWRTALPSMIWALVAEGRFREAFYVRRFLISVEDEFKSLPDVHLLEALALSRETLGGTSSSRFAERLEPILVSFTLRYLEGKFNSDPAQSLLAVAACLRPTFISEGLNGASTGLLREAIREVDGRLAALRVLSFSIAEFADHHCPFDLVAAKGKKYWESALADVRAEAREWLERAPHRNMIYTQAINLWKEWIGKTGRLSLPLAIVEADDYSNLPKVRKLIEDFPSEESIKREVQKHQSIIKQPEIKANALRHLCEFTLAGVRVARKWVDLKERMESRRDSFRTKCSEELVARLKSDCPLVIAELDNYSSDVLEETAAAKACRVIVSSILYLVDSSDGQELKEPEFEWHVNEIGFHLPSADVPVRENPKELAVSAQEIAQVFVDDDWSIGHAFKSRLAALDFGSLESIIEHIRSRDRDSKELIEFERLRSAKALECNDILRKKIQAVQAQVEEAVSNNVLKEAERSGFVGRIDSIFDQSEKGKLLDYRKAFSQLDIIATDVRSLVDRRRDEVMTKIARIESVDETTRDRLKNLAKMSDFVTVEDYIGKLKSGETLPFLDSVIADPATRFLEKAEAIDRDFRDPETGKDRVNYIRWFAQRIRERKPIQGLNIEKSTGASTSRFAAALDVWAEIRRFKTCDTEQIGKILKAMGFLTIKKLVKDFSSTFTWLKLTTEIISDREQCQSPVFGSLAKGCYRILCIYEGYEEEQLVTLVGDTTNREPVIVLLFRRLTLSRRRNLAALCIEKRRSFIVVDELLFLSLADSDNPQRSLFSSALPFSFAEPYLPTSSVVPREMFFGRKFELESIIDPRGSCFIYGGRQLGKTVLLREAERRAHNESIGKIAVWIDLNNHGIGRDRALEELWSVIGAELAKYGIVPQKETQNLRPEKLKQRIMDWLAADNTRSILLLLDEADRFLERDGQRAEDGKNCFVYSSVLKGFMESSERRIKIVFAGLHNVQRMTKLANHPLAHLGDPLCIGPLTDRDEAKEAEALIRAPLEAVGYKISQDLVYRILALTNYYPSLIQLFCQELLKHLGSRVKELFNPRDTPPRVISSKHVEEAYRSENLRKAIRDRFYWTLQLDQRYEVIAYAMAYTYLSDPTADPPLAMSVARIRDSCIDWWKAGFAESSHEEIRALLDEMVGLGVLRNADGRYAFRNSNILRLLGTEEEIAGLLVQDRNPPLEFAPVHMRDIKLANGKFAISPFTASQEASLRKASDDVRVVILPPMVSAESFEGFLGKMFKTKIMWGMNNLFAADLADFGKRLKARMANAEAGTYAVVYESSLPWSIKHIREAMSVIRKKGSPSYSFHVIFVADPNQVWSILQDDRKLFDELLEGDDRLMRLGKMHDQSLRYWLEEQPDYSLSRSKENRVRLMEKTGGWPVMVEHFHKTFLECGKDFNMAVQRIENGFVKGGSLPFKIEDVIIEANDLRAKTLFALRENAKFEDFSESELMKTMGNPDKSEVACVLEWAKSLGYLNKVGDAEWVLDTFVGRLIDKVKDA